MRMILLWVYIIFSPAAFLLSAFPAGRSYANKWISGFTQQLVAGPILAFFIWLAMILSQDMTNFKKIDYTANVCASVTDITCINYFLPFIMSIGLMMAGLMVAQSAGGMAGGAASWGMGKIKQGKSWGMKKANSVGKDTATKYGRTAVGATGGLLRAGANKDSSRYKVGKFMGDVRQDSLKKERDAKATKRVNTLKKFGMSDDNIEALGKAADTKTGRLVKSAGVIGAGAATGNIPLGVAGVALGAGSLMGGKLRDWAGRKEEKRKSDIGDADKQMKKNIVKLQEHRDEKLEELEMEREAPEKRVQMSKEKRSGIL